jgi:hypothetical protein
MQRRAFIDVCQHGYMYLVPGTKVHIYIYMFLDSLGKKIT